MTRWPVVLPMFLMLGHCPKEEPVPVSDACGAFQVIRPHTLDTPGTKRQALAHNDTWRRLCAPPPAKKP